MRESRSRAIKEYSLGIYDGRHATPKESPDGPVFLGINNITNDGHIDLTGIRHISEDEFPFWTQRVTPEPGDVVFTYEATLHRYTVIPDGFRGCLGRRLALIRPNPSLVDSRYLLYYFLSHNWRQVVERHIVTGATVDRIPIEKFPDFPVVIPDIQTQKSIVGVLSSYDDLIENNRRRMTLLEQATRVLYREWFVRLRFPGYEHIPIVNGVPEGWECKQLDEISSEIREIVSPTNIEPDTPYIGLEHMPRHSISLSSWGQAEQVTSTKNRFRAGEILFGKIRPYFHKVGIAFVDGVASSDAIVIRPTSDTLRSLVLMTVSSDAFVAQAAQTMREGSKMPRADWKLMKQYRVSLPPEGMLNVFNSIIDPTTEQLRTLAFQNQRLQSARDLLLPRLMSGEITV